MGKIRRILLKFPLNCYSSVGDTGPSDGPFSPANEQEFLMRRFALVLSLLAVLGFALQAAADTTITGEKKGAFFKITVPTGWNGDLVIYNHGYDFDFIDDPGLGPIAPLWLSQGYAVAASGHSMSGWVLFNSKRDTERMVDVFIDEFGAPNDVYVVGFSLGGIVSAQLVEKLDGVNIVGSYPLCGALAGSRLWDGGIDVRLIYDVICGAIAPIPGGATGLPSPGHPNSPITQLDTLLATSACMDTPFVFGVPGAAARRAQFAAVTQLPESAIAGDVVFGTHGVSNVVWEPAKLDGENGMSNIGVIYPDAGVNAAIQRVTPVNKARKRLQRNFTPKGDVGATKIVSLHTDGDGLIIVENESEYQSVVPASNLTVAIVDEAGNTHCGFNEAEITGGWLALTGWVAGLPQPSAADVQGACLLAQAGGAGTFPGGGCRIDPNFVIPDMDGRIPPR
jgi:pimeloyl-ACP methyl ester carboxylesterase